MIEAERKALFLALRGSVESIRDPAVVRQLEEIAAAQLLEIEPMLDELLHARTLRGVEFGVAGCCLLHRGGLQRDGISTLASGGKLGGIGG